MGVFAMFRRKRKGAAEVSAGTAGVIEVTEATEATEATETDVTEDGGVTRVTVAGLTAPEPVPAGSASEESASEEPASKAPSGEGVPEAESEEAVAEVVEIPRQQSAGTAADADSETGGTARR